MLSTIDFVFYWSLKSEVVFHWGCLPLRSSSIEIILHLGHLQLRLSSIEVVFHWGRLSLSSSSIEIIFHWGRLPMWLCSNNCFVCKPSSNFKFWYFFGWRGVVKSEIKLTQSSSRAWAWAGTELGNIKIRPDRYWLVLPLKHNFLTKYTKYFQDL